MDSSLPSQPNRCPGEPTSVVLSMTDHAANNQPVQHIPQSSRLPEGEEFKTSMTFAIVKFVLGSVNLIFAIVALGFCLRDLFPPPKPLSSNQRIIILNIYVPLVSLPPIHPTVLAFNSFHTQLQEK